MRSAVRLTAMTILLAAGACATGSGRGSDLGGRPDTETPLRVQNQSWLDMRIYVLAGGQRVRLGMVNANSSATLRIPGYVIGLGREVSFLADPLASDAVARSFSLYVHPGEEVMITIPPTVR